MSLADQLSLFADVVNQGSFSKAADLHDMDKSTLSKQIKKLESTLGVQLLNRSTRKLSLTPAGEEILEKTYKLLDALKDIQETADSYQSTPKGALRITASVAFGQLHLQPAITRFMKKYPDVKISLYTDDKRTDIIADKFDLAFRIGKLEDSNLIAKKIANTNFAIVASKELIKQHGAPKSCSDLAALPAVIYSNGEVCLDSFLISETPHSDTLIKFRLKGNLIVSDVKTMIDAVKDGLGYTVIDLFNLDRSVEDLGLVTILTDHKLSTMDTGIYVIYPSRKQTKLAAEFIKEFQAFIGTPPYWEDHLPGFKQLYK